MKKREPRITEEQFPAASIVRIREGIIKTLKDMDSSEDRQPEAMDIAIMAVRKLTTSEFADLLAETLFPSE